MSNLVVDRGENNTIELGNGIVKDAKSIIRVLGNNNKVLVDDNVKFNNVNFTLKGHNICVHIGENVELTGVILSIFMDCSFEVGKNTTLGRGEVTIAEATTVTIGKDCMFAHDWEIRTSDMHPIYSLENGERINHGASIKIGNHIWTGRAVRIIKGVELADNIVIGMNSLVTNSIVPGNCIAVGSPAQVVKSNVIWGRKMFYKTMFDDPTLEY